MSKRKLLLKFVFACSILCTCGEQACGNIIVAYVSSSEGSDDNNGTMEHPVKTIAKAQKLADTLMLKSGDIFYETVVHRRGKIGKYGKGQKPMLCGWKRIITPRWEQVEPDVWKIALCDDNYTGFQTEDYPARNNVGCIHEYDKNLIHGRRVQYYKELKEDWDMWQTPHHSRKDVTEHDFDTLYVKYSGNPNKLKIEFSVGTNGMVVGQCILEDVRIEGFGQCGIGVETQTTIRRCEVDAIGGMTQMNESAFTSLGNGVEVWIGKDVEDCLIEDCVVSRCYDCGMSLQGDWQRNGHARNIVFQNNVIIECCQGWEDFLNSKEQDEFHDCYFRNNIVINSGKTSGFNYPAGRRKYCHVLSGNSKVNRHMRIYGNYFVGGNYYCALACQGEYKANLWKDNTCIIRRGDLIMSNYDGSKDVLMIPLDTKFSVGDVIAQYRQLTGDTTTKFVIKSERKVNREIKRLKRKYSNS